MNHEVILGDDGSVWLLADLWRCRDGGNVTGLVRHDDWSSCEYDWMSNAFDERIGRVSGQIGVTVNVQSLLRRGHDSCVS